MTNFWASKIHKVTNPARGLKGSASPLVGKETMGEATEALEIPGSSTLTQIALFFSLSISFVSVSLSQLPELLHRSVHSSLKIRH